MAVDWEKLDKEAGIIPSKVTEPEVSEELTTPITDPTDVDIIKEMEDKFFADLDVEAAQEPDYAALDIEAGLIPAVEVPTGITSEPVPKEPEPLTPEQKDIGWLSQRGYDPKAAYLLVEQEGVKYKKHFKGRGSVRTIDEEKLKETVFEENLKSLPRNHPVKVEHRKWKAYNDKIKDVLIKKGLIKPDKQYTGLWDKFTDSVKSSTVRTVGAAFGTAASAARAAGDIGLFSAEDLQTTADNIYQTSEEIAPAQGGGWQGAVVEMVGQTLPYSIAAIGARVLTGYSLASFGVGFVVEGDAEYRAIKAAGGSEFKAELGRAIVGTINGAIETLQVSHVVNFAKPSKTSLKSLVKLAAKGAWKRVAKEGGALSYEILQLALQEGLEEALQETASIGMLNLTVPETFDPKQAMKQIGLAGLGGMVVGTALGGAGRVMMGGKTSNLDEMRPKREVPDMPTIIETAEGTIGYESSEFDTPIVNEFAEKLHPKKATPKKVGKKKRVKREFNPTTVKKTVDTHNETGGSTIDIETGKAVKKGYAVGIDTGVDKTFEKVLDKEKITEKDVRDYIKEHKADLEANKNRTVETWISDGKSYLDIVEVLDDEFKAMELGRETNQQAIFNLETSEELEVEVGTSQIIDDSYEEANRIFNEVRSSTEKGINKKNKDRVVGALTDSLKDTYKKDVIGLKEGFFKTQLQHAGKQFKKFHYWMAREYQAMRALDGGKDGLFVNFFYKTKKDKVVEAHVKNANTLEKMKGFLVDIGVDFDKFFKPTLSIEVNGNPRYLSQSQRVEVYLSTLNNSNLRHLKANGLTDEQINEIATSITDQEMEVANWLLGEYNSVWDSVAHVYYQLTGTSLGRPKNFSPIVTDTDYINFTNDFEETLFDRKMTKKRGLSTGELKKRLHSNTPLRLNGAIENYMGYMVHTNMYTSLATVAADVGEILNDRKFQQKLKDATNHDLAKDMRKTLEDTLSNTTRTEVDLIDKLTNSLRRNAVTFLLGGNIVTMMRQPMSMFLATAENPRMIPFMVHNMTNLIKNYSTMKAEVYEKSPVVRTRSMERELRERAARVSIERSLKGTKSLRDLSFVPLQFMDRSTVVVVWQSAYDLSMAQGNGEFESRTYADSIVTRTQPMAGFEDLPPAFRGGAMSKLFSAFQNQVNQNFNYWAHDIYGAKKAGRLSNQEFAYRILMGHIVPAFFLGVVSRGRMPTKKELLADEFGYFAGMYYFFGQWINSAIKGYSASNISAFSGMDNINRMASTNDPIKKALFFAKGAGAITGLPLNQAIRSLEGCMDLWDGETDDVMRIIYSEAQRKGMKEKENNTNLARIKGGTKQRTFKGRRL